MNNYQALKIANLLKASFSMTMLLFWFRSILKIFTSLNVVFLTISLLFDSLNFLIATIKG